MFDKTVPTRLLLRCSLVVSRGCLRVDSGAKFIDCFDSPRRTQILQMCRKRWSTSDVA